jgi:hypothetical protein
VNDARFVFTLAGSIWTMGRDGMPSFLRPPSEQLGIFRRAPFPIPVWSPRGDRVLTTELVNGNTGALSALVLEPRTGAATRLSSLGPVGRIAAWSPDGASVAAVGLPSGGSVLQVGGINQIQDTLEIRFATLEDKIDRAPVPGREVAWTAGGLFVISNGTFVADPRSRTGLAVERVEGATRRPVVTMAALLADPRSLATATAAIPALADLGAAADGTFVSVRLTYATALGEATRSMLTISRTDTGRPAAYLPLESTSDLQWAPRGARVAYTALGPVQAGTRSTTATVFDPATGEVLARVEGARFAGWSPEGTGFYVSRESGLFQHALGSATGTRVSPIGVPVMVAPARS